MSAFIKTSFILLFACGSFVGIQAMQQAPARAPAAHETKDLVIINKHIFPLSVAYMRQDRPGVFIRFKMQPGETREIPDVNTLTNLRFGAEGRYLGKMNFDETNYREKINDQVWKQTPWPANVVLEVRSELVPQLEVEQPQVAAAQAQPAGWGEWAYESMKKATFKGTDALKQSAQRAAAAVLPFLIPLPARVEQKIPENVTPNAFVEHNRRWTYKGKPLYELFPSAKKRIRDSGDFYGRDLLGVGENWEMLDMLEAHRNLEEEWNARRTLYRQDPVALRAIDYILELLREAAEQPNKKFPAERL